MENLLAYQRIITGHYESNLIKISSGFCPDHPTQVYMERVSGDLFQCAHIEHHEQSITISTTNKTQQLHDR